MFGRFASHYGCQTETGAANVCQRARYRVSSARAHRVVSVFNTNERYRPLTTERQNETRLGEQNKFLLYPVDQLLCVGATVRTDRDFTSDRSHRGPDSRRLFTFIDRTRLPLQPHKMVIREPHLRSAITKSQRLPKPSGATSFVCCQLIAARQSSLQLSLRRCYAKENSECGLARKMLFVVTTRELAMQQARVLLEQIPMLKTDENLTTDDNAAWRLGLLIGHGSDEADTDTRSSTFFQHTQVCVVIDAKLEEALIHGYLQMEDVALLVMDEAHHARGNSIYATIAKYFYAPCERRPRVLALTASPVEAAAGTPTSEKDFY